MKAFKPIKYRRVYLRARPTTTAAAASGSGTVNLEDETPSESEAGGSETPLIGRTPLGAMWWWNGSAWSQIAAMIALLFATLAANAAASPPYQKTPLTTNSLATAATLLTARQFLGAGSWASVTDHGAVPDDTGDDTAAFTAALGSGATAVMVPAGHYLVGGVRIPSNVQLIGVGRPVIQYTNSSGSDAAVFDTVTTPSTNYAISGIDVCWLQHNTNWVSSATVPPRGGGSGGDVFGIKAQTWGPNLISDVNLYGFTAAALRLDVGASTGSGEDKMANLLVSRVNAWNNQTGLESVTGEYVRIADSAFWRNSTNGVVFVGNVFVTGSRFTDGHVGARVSGANGGNEAHGSFTGCEFNHNSVAGVYCDDLDTGHVFSGCNIWSDNIYLVNCAGVTFTGCNGSPDAIYARGTNATSQSGYNLFQGCVFSAQPSLWLQNLGVSTGLGTNSWDMVDFRDCKVRGTGLPIGMANGLQAYWPLNEYGGTRTDRVRGVQMIESAATIYGTNGVAYSSTTPTRMAADFLNAGGASLYAPGTGPLLAAGNTAWSVGFWCYLSATNNQTLLSKYDPAGGKEWIISVTNSPAVFKAEFFDGSASTGVGVTTTSAPALIDKWHYVVVTHDTGTGTGKMGLHVFQSGNYAASTSISATSTATTTPIRIGALHDGTQASTARIDELVFYNRVLSAADRYNLFNGFRHRFILGD